MVAFPQPRGYGQHDRKVYRYGVGIDCHLTFFAICILVPHDADLTTSRLKVRAERPQVRAGDPWVLSTCAATGSTCARKNSATSRSSRGHDHAECNGVTNHRLRVGTHVGKF